MSIGKTITFIPGILLHRTDNRLSVLVIKTIVIESITQRNLCSITVISQNPQIYTNFNDDTITQIRKQNIRILKGLKSKW